ncbi:hypothetical protein B296_00006917 [Ensete ventricosum]|uniref:Uncharacterized protein n=1 Tax=Ensete ventricosum TaxID=4639 RepID=A0A426ZVM0_ENSVE|nr:hypothetical protein B296_00006917 [Ensete ventricosum]
MHALQPRGGHAPVGRSSFGVAPKWRKSTASDISQGELTEETVVRFPNPTNSISISNSALSSTEPEIHLMAPEDGWAVNRTTSSSSSPVVTEKLLAQHKEKHFTAGDMVRDVIMGVSDGLTVPFALAAGLSGANAPSSLILTAGLAEVAAGAISMGLGGSVTSSAVPFPAAYISKNGTSSPLVVTAGQELCTGRSWNARLIVYPRGRYLAAKSEADHYIRELKREQEEIITVPDTEAAEVGELLSQYGLEPHEYGPIVNSLRKKPQAWLEFELGLEKPDPRRALESAVTIALSYVVGGMVPLLPYVFIPTALKAMFTSIGLTLVALLFFGYIKGHFTGSRPFLSAVQTAFIGALASAAAYALAKAVQAV